MIPGGQPPSAGAAVYDLAVGHPGMTALRRVNRLISAGRVESDGLKVFFASMGAFVEHITPGIPALASRLADSLLPFTPFRAHRIAARILDASIDEFGLSGSKPHSELLYDFAAHFGFREADVRDPAAIVPAAAELGERLFSWYRHAPIPFALGMHTASEATGHAEAQGFHAAFLAGPSYGLARDLPAFAYVATHVENEDDHSRDVVVCLDEYLDLLPPARSEVERGCLSFMRLYQALFEQMADRMAPADAAAA